MYIKVYWRSYCSSCKRLFEYLDQKGILHERIDVTTDQDKFDEMLRHGGFATPLIIINDQVITYFDPEKLDSLLEECL